MPRLPYLVAAAAFVLPLPAFADCAQRIEAVESHPAIIENSDAEVTTKSEAAPAGSEEATVKAEVVEGGDAIREDGGETVYQEGGPAAPVESWFTGDTEKSEVLTHLDTARKAQDSGDEKACLDAIEQAETILKKPEEG